MNTLLLSSHPTVYLTDNGQYTYVYMLDDDGNILLDDNGNPIINDSFPPVHVAGSERILLDDHGRRIFLHEGGDWDLTLDVSGNLAVATGHYAIAQDVASAARLFLGELWYDTTQGVPYYEEVLGVWPPPSLEFLKARLVAAGLTVPGVSSIKCFLTGPGPNREVGGQMQITNDTDNLLTVIESTSILQIGVPPWYVNASNVGVNG